MNSQWISNLAGASGGNFAQTVAASILSSQLTKFFENEDLISEI